ncbi:glycosyltransferase family 2 protein [Saccharicrinis aurantiacus]|uniref:glycosyltransferase family 2 protein n=1 Tax=Saccharicrinis aurantiacus TaxID=1849719 RepID=UPI00249172B5|nr:glycosyltransferase family 2 protein [Saccharicrinis aurantiacus]
MEESIVVSVIALVYNQEEYLEQMIESVLMQKTNFNFEFIIANDCSQDHSEKLIQKYASKHSNIIFINNKENLGLVRNYANCLRTAKGEYLAFCGGDDFWIHNNKLQMQVDFLKANPDYSVVHTQFDELYMYKKRFQRQYKKNVLKKSQVIKGNAFYDIATNNTINSVTICYRKSIIDTSDLIDKFEDEYYFIEDSPELLTLSRNHKVGYINISTVCYRRNKYSVSHFKKTEDIISYDNKVVELSKSFLTDGDLKLPEVVKGFEQREAIMYTYIFFKANDLRSFKYYYARLNSFHFDRFIMLTLLKLRLAKIFS